MKTGNPDRLINIRLIMLGFVSLVSQTVLLRELMVHINGNEIIYAVFLPVWMLAIACGSLLVKNWQALRNISVSFLQIIALLVILTAWLLISPVSAWLTPVSGMMIRIPLLLCMTILILAPGCLLLGMMFPLLTGRFSAKLRPVHTAYIMECLGIIGGGIFLYVTLSLLSNFQVLLLLAALNLIVLFITDHRPGWLAAGIILLIMLFPADRFTENHYSIKYQPQTLLSTRDSHYGRFDICLDNGQYNYYWNGQLFANSDNQAYAGEIVRFVLLQHPQPSRILLLGGSLNGLPEAILEDDRVQRLQIVELDQNILAAVERIESDRLQMDLQDPRFFLNTTDEVFDLILIDLPDPLSLNMNRFYTREFLQTARERLCNESSLLALTLNNGTNFMTEEIRNLNSTMLQTMSPIAGNLIIIPSQKNIFLSSNSDYITNNPFLLHARNITENQWFNFRVIFERCNDFRLEEITSQLDQTAPANTDLSPAAYFYTLKSWARVQDLPIKPITNLLQNRPMAGAIILIVCILLAGTLGRLLTAGSFPVVISIMAVSSLNFVLQLLLINLFQIRFGNIYLFIFLFTTIFMCGLATGFSIGGRFRLPIALPLAVNTLIVLTMIFLADKNLPRLAFYGLNFLTAVCEGILLSTLLKSLSADSSRSRASVFYFLDSLGPVWGGLIFGILILPVYGIRLSFIFSLLIILLLWVLNIRLFGKSHSK